MGRIIRNGVDYTPNIQMVEPNPEEAPTETLETLGIGSTVYELGGGNAKEQELTWTEYQALTPAQQTDGTTYYITDLNMNGTGDQFQPVIYSEAEREIGVWCDGKPLYQKTWIIPKASLSSGETTYTHNNNLSIDTLVNVCGATTDGRPLVEYHTNGSWACSIYNIGSNAFWIYLGGSVYSGMTDASTVKVTLQYTKTTDQPGSGTWTPQGVPAHHYSTDEQIVGTWIDGDTLYERSYTFPSGLSVSGGGAWVSTGIDISDVDLIIDVKTFSTGGHNWPFAAVNNTSVLHVVNPFSGSIAINYITIRYTKIQSSQSS